MDRCWRRWFVGCWRRRHRLFFGLLALGAARFGRFLRNLAGLEAYHADARFPVIGRRFGAKREQHEQQQRRDQNRQADGKRASPRPDAERFDKGSGWNRGQLSNLWWRRPLVKVPGLSARGIVRRWTFDKGERRPISEMVAGGCRFASTGQSALFFGYGRREIGILVRHPIDEFAHAGVGQQAFDIHPVALQLGIGKIGDQRLLANAVHGNNISAAPTFGHRVVPDNGFASGASTQPAGYDRGGSLLLAMQMSIGILFRVSASHMST